MGRITAAKQRSSRQRQSSDHGDPGLLLTRGHWLFSGRFLLPLTGTVITQIRSAATARATRPSLVEVQMSVLAPLLRRTPLGTTKFPPHAPKHGLQDGARRREPSFDGSGTTQTANSLRRAAAAVCGKPGGIGEILERHLTSYDSYLHGGPRAIVPMWRCGSTSRRCGRRDASFRGFCGVSVS